ncbi:undecaprenyldiphospho-muramoylpentapeptide beta-N-acetylglucosaminyltransferase [Burkholderiaceae bacterium DAT-1]|nr:undecaprenyldiphospho-muramoylpentapeptide beta-N-acetylglucosaminyltransferase [Burkholderiaceae bacterium DAT-1]
MKTLSPRTLIVMAGGTGGHIFPALAVAKEMQTRGWQVVWLGACGKMEETLVPQHGLPIELLPVRGLRGNGLMRKLTAPFEQLKAVMLALRVFRRHRPAAAIGFGGFTAFPGGVAAKLLGVPLFVHEQNSVAGLTNRALAQMGATLMKAFPEAFAGRGELVGNPVRSEITAQPEPAARFAGRTGSLKVLVVGGSLGAAALNEAVPQALARLPLAERPLVTHQSGTKQIEALRSHYAQAGVEANCVAFIDDMAAAYAEADLVVCRAGALTVSELAAVGVGAIFVPFPHAVDDHQTGNARYLAENGAALLIQQRNLTPDWLAQQLKEMTRERLLTMAERARTLGKPEATRVVADRIETNSSTHKSAA